MWRIYLRTKDSRLCNNWMFFALLNAMYHGGLRRKKDSCVDRVGTFRSTGNSLSYADELHSPASPFILCAKHLGTFISIWFSLELTQPIMWVSMLRYLNGIIRISGRRYNNRAWIRLQLLFFASVKTRRFFPLIFSPHPHCQKWISGYGTNRGF